MKAHVSVLLAGAVVAACTSPAPAAPTATAVTPAPGPTAQPTSASTAPGHALIAYEWFEEGSDVKSIFVANLDGSDAHVVGRDIPGEHRGPTWSPDGQRIAFVARGGDTPEGAIWTMNPDGSDARILFDPNENDSCPIGGFWPSWSPDGGRIAFVCYPGGDEEALSVIDLESLAITKLMSVHFPEHLDNPASWSPDGTTIAFDLQHWAPTNDVLDGSRIGTMPAAGGDATWLTDLDTFTAWADWHPTDELIAYNTFDLGQMHDIDQPSNLFTIRADGAGVTQITHLANPNKRVAQARWLPDGSGFIASCSYGNPVRGVQICLVDPSTGEISYMDHVLSGARAQVQPTQ